MANAFVAGRFSSTWKAGLMTPLLKKPGLDAGDFKNFRPITNLTTLSKILERLALAGLKSHIVTSPNYCSLQSAYRIAQCTETALVKIVDDILTLVDSGSAVALVGLDISAAFGIVGHSKLLSRLEHDFSIEGAALRGSTRIYRTTLSVSVLVGVRHPSQSHRPVFCKDRY